MSANCGYRARLQVSRQFYSKQHSSPRGSRCRYSDSECQGTRSFASTLSSPTPSPPRPPPQTTPFLSAHPPPDLTSTQTSIRTRTLALLESFPDTYWTHHDTTHTFPTTFHQTLASSGLLGVCMPTQYGGLAHGISEAAVLVQTVAESGAAYAGASTVHMNIFGLEPVRKFATESQRQRMLVPLIQGKERACFGVTEPNTGLDTTKLQSTATRADGDDHYALKGSKIWISTAQVAEKILILVRTTPIQHCRRPSHGLSLFYTDLDRNQVSIAEIRKMGRGAVDSNLLHFDGWRVPADDRIGEEGAGFKMIMHGMNAERILIAAEALGIGFAALRRASEHARIHPRQEGGMEWFDDDDTDATRTTTHEKLGGGGGGGVSSPVGANQSVQHPLADSWMQLESARLMVYQAARLYDQGHESGEYANAAKYLAAEAAFRACERAVVVVAEESTGTGADVAHVERYFREVLIPRIAPVSREMICNYIGERVLGMPRSY